MSDEHAAVVADLFKCAVELAPAERQSFLQARCQSDPELKAEVESLLQIQERSAGFLETPAPQTAANTFASKGAFAAGERVGHYEILSLIGSGGMGEVYLALDPDLKRQVALKLVHYGSGTHHVLRRFRQEEQILAGLNHPNIAQLYGSGVTPLGAPFFAMEYVEGTRIDDYCRYAGLTIRQRLELFTRVCAAVHYAHQHLVVHRDIKPSNVLVTAQGEPKLLDFGIAKLLEQQTDLADRTITVAAIMTPEYASPEHIRAEPITTAADIYSLGVLLYELLTGRKPYQIETRTPIEIARVVSEVEPAKPSDALATNAKNSEFGPRLTGAFADSKALKGDLDNIVLMALRKEPARRYASAAQFAADIRRHLDGRPVIAHKDTLRYRTSKFVRRHQVGVAAAALVLLTLIGGIVATLWQARATRLAKTKAEHINRFLGQMLEHSNPLLRDGHDTTMTEVLDEAAKRIDGGEFASQPEIQSELERIIGESYYAHGKNDQAEEHLAKYLALQRQLYGENNPKTVAALATSAQFLFIKGRVDDAEKIYRRTLPIMRREEKNGQMKPRTLAEALNTFGWLRRSQGDSVEAEALFREALSLNPRLRPDESRYPNGTTRSTLASTLADQGKFREALQTAREAVTEHERRGESETPNAAFALTILGGFLAESGNYSEADAVLNQAEAILRRAAPLYPLWLGDNLRNEAWSLYRQHRYAELRQKSAESLEVYRKNFGPHYDQYPTAMITDGLAAVRTGQTAEGEQILRDALRIRSESLPKEHFWVALAQSALGECLALARRHDEAEPLLLESYRTLEKSQGPNNPRTRLAAERLATFYEMSGRLDLARPYRSVAAIQSH